MNTDSPAPSLRMADAILTHSDGLTQRSRAHLNRRVSEKRVASEHANGQRFLDHEAKHYVYRCWDADGRLLYIGCTRDLEGRMAMHRTSWGNPASAYLILHMDRHEAEPEAYTGRRAGRAAERAAIEAEAPLLNVHHNAGRSARRAS